MEFRRTFQAIAFGLALCLPAVLARVGLLGDDPEPSRPAPTVAVVEPTVAPSTPAGVAAGTTASIGGDSAPEGRLFATGVPGATLDEASDLALRTRDTGEAPPDQPSRAPYVGGGSFASASGGSPMNDRGPYHPTSGPGSAGVGATGGGPVTTGAAQPTHATGGAEPAAPSTSSASSAGSAATTDVAANDEGHRRGVRSLAGSSVAATQKRPDGAESTPSSDPGSASAPVGEDSTPDANPSSGNDEVPFVFDATSETPFDAGSGDGRTDGPPFPGLSTDPSVQDPALVPARASAAIPEPGTMVLLFLGLLALNVTRGAAVRKAGILRRALHRRRRAREHAQAATLTQST